MGLSNLTTKRTRTRTRQKGTIDLSPKSKHCQAYALDPVEIRLRNLRKTVYTAGQLFEQHALGQRRDCWMLTLTYRGVDDWKPNHIRSFIAAYKAWCARKGHALSYVWVMELQKRGAPHYHVLVWLPRGISPLKPDKQGWWPHGFSNTVRARRRTGYLMKYVSKTEFLYADSGTGFRFPKGARLYGAGGLDREKRRVVRYWRAPGWVRESAKSVAADLRKVVGGWIDAVSSSFFPSLFRFLGIIAGRPVVYKVDPGFENDFCIDCRPIFA